MSALRRLARPGTLAAWLVLAACAPADPPAYQKPPKAITDVLDAPPPPLVSVGPAHDVLLLVQADPYPPIAEVAAPMLRLAGLRIDPAASGPHLPPRYVALALQPVAGGKPVPVALPPQTRLGLPAWSPDGKRFAFTVTRASEIRLWVGEAASGKARQVSGVLLNAAYGAPFHWLPGGQGLLCQTVVADRGKPPAAPRVPAGPVVQESSGKPAPVRTYQDLLQTPHDEDLFDYYAASQLVLVDLRGDRVTPLGKPGVFASVTPAPDGQHFLAVRNHRPYSYLLPAFAFPKEVEVWDRAGKAVARIASLPLAEGVPIDGVPTGPRDFHWVPTEPATLVWAEALDGGDPRKKVEYRDQLKRLRVGETSAAELVKVRRRFAGLTFGPDGAPSLLSDYDRDTRRRRTFLFDPAHPEAEPRLLWDRSVQDRYGDPGTPVLRTLPCGHQVLWVHDGHAFLTGNGATPTGDRPFLDRLDLKTLKSDRLFRCEEKTYESVAALLADDGTRFLTRHETAAEPPNYFVRTAGGDRRALTHFTDPAPQLRGIRKRLVTYKRADGVPLSMTLYLPADYKEGERRPALMWAYPLEYNDAATAGQVSGSPDRFTTPAGPSHLFLLTQGYVVLDGASMPVVGSPEKVNDTYVEQIVSGARAAIDKADELGVIDRKRVGVGGHSYGAFMTANLLAHCDLFRAGVARSGAYNRTLTPFGFQSERRTLWEAPETYLKMSPFQYADKIKAPLLLIHGEADNNPGTFPVQSERMYQAVKGNGGTVRYVVLPGEAHGYAARESVEQTLYEMVTWLDRHVKGARD
ncbi:MAG TPA: prolyl oligopeptidase family serine peptidase [Gemmataceae bacterium]|nr:prolyl oligopeptidase family serine peptidase [Gemmataceae bacterium]